MSIFKNIGKKRQKIREERCKFKKQKLLVENKEINLQDRHYFILMLLLKDRPMDFKDLEERSVIFVSQFGSPKRILRTQKRQHWEKKREHRKEFNLKLGCEELSGSSHIRLTPEGKYELTPQGEELARMAIHDLEKGAYYVRKFYNKFLKPNTVAKVTIFFNFFLALIKLVAGFVSGSIALLADGADAAMDTVSAFIVWMGIKFKIELLGTFVIIIMMFITAASIGVESVSNIVGAVKGTLEPIFKPLLIISVETVALIAAFLLYFYQHHSGRKFGNLSLISQSVDSKNHIYIAVAVIFGALFSIFGIHFVDSLIGAFIAVRISLDAVELTKMALSRAKGEDTDFSRYQTFAGKKWQEYKLESFRNWLLYTLMENGESTREQLLNFLNMTYKPKYIPIISEFEVGIGRDFDFEGEFERIIRPLLDKNLVVRKGDEFLLTKMGSGKIESTFRMLKYWYG
jgi:Co/Zn/Cd efflux system component